MNLISDGYRALLAQKHADRPWGGGGASWVPALQHYIPAFADLPRVLDFGCGRHTFKHRLAREFPTIYVEEYDPGLPGLDDPTVLQPADLVMCTDVLEHVEEEFIDETLKLLALLTKRYCFLVIDCNLSGSLLPDGRNTHILVKPAKWWHRHIAVRFGKEFSFNFIERGKGRLVIMLERAQDKLELVP